MESRRKALLQLPQGARALFFEEAERHLDIVAELRTLFTAWGYQPVQTPVFDFFDVYRGLLDHNERESIYRLIDREGDLLMLRSDITLFLAKHLGSLISLKDLPLRLWYADTILRHQDREDISKNEFFQAGAELIGSVGLCADCEILALLVSALENLLGREGERFVHLGSRGLFEACFAESEAPARQSLAAGVAARDRGLLIDILGRRRERLADLFLFIGERKDFASLRRSFGRSRLLPPAALAEIGYLEAVMDELDKAGLGRNFRIDLSEIGGQPYYSGLVFKVYMDGLDSALASGGRYDHLLERFGRPAPAVGFSIMLSKLERYRRQPPTPPCAPHQVTGDDFATAFARAQALRAGGRAAVIKGKGTC